MGKSAATIERNLNVSKVDILPDISPDTLDTLPDTAETEPKDSGHESCICCYEPIKDDDVYYITDSDFEFPLRLVEINDPSKGFVEGPLCRSCYECDTDDPQSAIVVSMPGEKEKSVVRVGCYLATISDTFIAYDILDVVKQLARGIHWVSTDAWRGYNDITPLDDWVTPISDWYGIDGYNIEGDLRLFHIAYHVEKKVPWFPIIVVHSRTSNVCSSCIDVLVRKENVENGDWYRYIGKPVETENEETEEEENS